MTAVMGVANAVERRHSVPRHHRPVILVFIEHYLPGFKAGGPIRTLHNMVQQLGDDFDFRLVTSDRDVDDVHPYPTVQVDCWLPHGQGSVFYRSPGSGGWRALFRSLADVKIDLIYLTGFYSVGGSIYPLVQRRLGRLPRRPVILAPRGDFSGGALSLKPLKKRLFIALSQVTGLHRDVVFQASSEFEASDIRKVFLSSPVSLAIDLGGRASSERITVARNLSGRSQNPVAPVGRDAGDRLRLAFLARIAPMKNLLGALEVLRRVRDADVDFDVYGTTEDPDYWARCNAAIATLPANIRVCYRGPVRPDEVETTLSAYDAFLFPTLGENYGHVIREALSAGLPVLISDQTPWRGLQARGAGADLPLDDLDAFADRIRAWATLPADRFRAMREAARALGDDPETARQALEANRRMFLDALRRNR